MQMTHMHMSVINELTAKAEKPSSNSNKHRHTLYAYIQSLIDGKPLCRSCFMKTNIDYGGVCPNCR
jgi:hypothetical protein